MLTSGRISSLMAFGFLLGACASPSAEVCPKVGLLQAMSKDHGGRSSSSSSTAADSGHGVVLPASKSAISFERMSKMPEPGWSVPRRGSISPDGKLFTYLASESGDMTMSLFALDLATHTTKVLLRASDLPGSNTPLSREEELRRERQRQRAMGITSFDWAEKAPVMLLPSSGDVFVRTADGKIKRLTDTKEPELDARICQTGERVAFVRADDLWVVDVATGKETRLTTGGVAGTTRGQSDFLAQEELDEPHGFFWSAGCDQIAYLEVDERKVAEHAVLGYRAHAPDLMMQKYPVPGAANPKVRAGIVDIKTKKTTWLKWPAEAERYLGRFAWASDGKALYLQTLDRLEKSLGVARVDVKTGEVKEILSESSPAWKEFTDFHILERSPRFLWAGEDAGHTHLELRDAATGARLKLLTKGDWDVQSIVRVDEANSRVFFIANKDAPLERQLYSVSLDGGEIKRWTEEPGVHMATVDSSARFVAEVHSSMSRPPKVIVRELGGALIADLTPPMDPEFASLRVRTPEIVKVDGPSGVALYGALLPPAVIEPGKRYPVVVMVYGGPGVQTVLDSWSPRLAWQHLADRGFVVFQMDNRGTAGRGPAFEKVLSSHVGDIELSDQIAGLDALGKLPYVDLKRVGIYGHSYGGYMAALALLKAPERFHVGVSGSPVTDWRLYDSAYTERYLGSPKDNAAAYDAADLTKMAGNLKGKLLLMHALMDENVHFQNSAELIDALVAANKRFDLLVFPGERHGYRAPAARRYAAERSIEYLAENLQ